MSAPGRVLLVEDDAELRGALSLVLRARGLEVTEAGDAAAALEELAARGFAAVVADLGLPDLAGSELLRRLRGEAPEARIVVLTGRSGRGLERACREAGADDVLTKPVSADRLAEVLTG